MLECSIVKPIHVVKKEADSFALIHFETEIDASTFYHIYCLQKKVVCPRLEGVTVNPTLIGNQPVIYSSFQVQPRITSSKKILCRCPPNNTGNSNSDPASITDSSNSNLNTPASNTINANATGSTVDDWRDDIEVTKLKIRNSIKRKSEEIADLQKRLRILEQI
ncbi:hypothetical protein INT48_007501 [Thamnidium elegans]|uniref:Uncharacterized protein n=1 Tax=Thamnidium elegans TaxID=101142 RepID=A0A8H7SLD1_9FUNG|nr:hypothetical protein INT48_007487 [Thamnidium elegans]KAG2231376.1 hypothetical protein INT48_007501 [Thamnidium elegans]